MDATNRSPRSSGSAIEPQSREEKIATRAYFKAAHRGFVPGSELEDWLAAEKEIDSPSDGLPSDRDADTALRPDPNSPLWRS
jgi:hypothetical protein